MNPVVIDFDKCKKDGICAAVCPRKLFILDDERKPSLHPETETLCIDCGHCIASCPPGAISLNGQSTADCTPVNQNIWPMFENLDHLMRSRRSIRAYKDTIVEKEVIDQILDTARYAPTGSNSQLVEWIVINDPVRMKELGQLVVNWLKECVQSKHPLTERLPMQDLIDAWDNDMDMILRGAPAAILNHAPEASGLPVENCTIAMTYLELIAPTKGIGTCWAGFLMIAAAFDEKIRNAIDIPEGSKLCGALMLGYPKYIHKRVPSRKDLSVTYW